MPKTELLKKTKLALPKMYKFYLLNDDETTMDFVISILMEIFHLEFNQACEKMILVHEEGEALINIYTQEIALNKQAQVSLAAKAANFPLQTRIEQE